MISFDFKTFLNSVWCVTILHVSFDILLLGIANMNVLAGTLMKCQLLWKDVDIVSELCITRANAVLPFCNLFLRGRVKTLRCHSSSTAFDKNKEVYLWVRPDAV